jgi:hypothetical protein
LIIATYTSETGIATVQSPLRFYHWGQLLSTEPEFGVDMRGEVILLSRNIVIAG